MQCFFFSLRSFVFAAGKFDLTTHDTLFLLRINRIFGLEWFMRG